MREGRLTALGEPVLEAKLLLAVATVSSDEGRKVPTPILLALSCERENVNPNRTQKKCINKRRQVNHHPIESKTWIGLV